MDIRVLQVGLGPIGAAVARQVAARKGFRLVGAVDIDPAKVGSDAGTVIGLDRRLRVRVGYRVGPTIGDCAPDVAVVCTSSHLRDVLPLFEEILARRVPIVTTTEEAAYPAPRNRRLARRLDEAARTARVAVLGTGVNPGFAMDALPIALTAVCERVDRIDVHRVQDARIRRLPFQQKIGAGLTLEAFREQVASGRVRHVGFAESIQMIGDAMGWRIDRVTDEVSPRIAETTVASRQMKVAAGRVCGMVQQAVGYVAGEAKVRLRLEAYLGAEQPYESILIEGSPRIYSRIDGGIHGDVATAAMAVNAIPLVLAASPGLRTMRDVRLPAYAPGATRATKGRPRSLS